MNENINDMYGNDDDDDRTEQPSARTQVNRTPSSTELMVDGQMVRIPNIDYVQFLERRLLQAEQTIKLMSEDMARMKQASRRGQSDMDTVRRRLDTWGDSR